MSDTNKKNYTVNDLMGEYFPSDKPDNPDTETEEISANDDISDSVEMETDTLEDDPEEAFGSDITIADKSEWESLEVAETVSEIFDGGRVSESEEADFSCSDTIYESLANAKENI